MWHKFKKTKWGEKYFRCHSCVYIHKIIITLWVLILTGYETEGLNALWIINTRNFPDLLFHSSPHKCQETLWSTWFLVNDQRDAQIPFYVFIFIFNSLRVSSTLCSSSGETNCDNTTSGNCHSVVVAVLGFTPNQHMTQNDSYQRLYWHNLSLLMMSMMCSKHVES